MAAEEQQPMLRDLRERCFALEATVGSILLPLLRVVPLEVSSALLAEVRFSLPNCVDDQTVDRERVAAHIRQFADQIETILSCEKQSHEHSH